MNKELYELLKRLIPGPEFGGLWNQEILDRLNSGNSISQAEELIRKYFYLK